MTPRHARNVGKPSTTWTQSDKILVLITIAVASSRRHVHLIRAAFATESALYGSLRMAALNVDAVPRPEPISSDASSNNSFNIGTRKSKLALVQTELVADALKKTWPSLDFQIHARDTAAGDIDKVTPFKDMPVKNLWTHELEQLLIERKLDILVHSLKGNMIA